MLSILAMCLVLATGFISIGAWIYRFSASKSAQLGWSFWLGWAITIAILQVWHFFAPINDSARILIILFALISLIINHRLILNGILPLSRIKLIWGLFAIILILWLANRATFSSEHYSAFGFDTGYYHIPTIKWFSEYPVILGLGNVHTRFSFSNAFFLYGALVNWDIFIGKTYQLVNTILYMVFLSQMIWSILSVVRNDKDYHEHYFRIICLPFVLYWLLLRHDGNLGVPSASNDTPVFMLGILLGGKIIHHIQKNNIHLRDLWIIGILVAVGITIKYNFIFGIGLMLIALGLYIIHHRKMAWIGVAGLAIIGVIFFVPMMIRSILMTGYPFYPLTIAGLNVDWRIPQGVGAFETEYIQAFARVLGDTPMYDKLINNPDWNWFPFWLNQSAIDYPLIFYATVGLPIIGVLILLITRFIPQLRPSQITPRIRLWSALFIVGFISSAFWFISAPSWRLSVGSTWFFSGSLFVFSTHYIRFGISKFIITCIVLAMLLFLWVDGFGYRGMTIATVTDENLPDPVIWVEQWDTYSGLTVNVAKTWLCWNYVQPCLPFPSFTPLLRERVFGDIAQGYRTTQIAMPFDPATNTIQLVSETFSALDIPNDTIFSLTIRKGEAIINTNIIPIPAPRLDDRNDIAYSLILENASIPPLEQGTYQIQGEWQNAIINIADTWQIQSFRFGDVLEVSDVVIRREDNRVYIQLVGTPLTPIPTRYHVAIWLRGENGTFQQDVSPKIPTHDWALDERYLIQAYLDNIPHGNYALSVVFYDVYAPDLPRLEGFDDQNNPLGDDVILLEGDF
ncbi:MAG: hypothetical protein MUE54_01175 [Anaerolineae bacterium]|nr:hypothetical protein [Anaerolineae bacterium]